MKELALYKRCIAEFLGTFCMVLCGTGAVVVESQTGQITHLGIAIMFGVVVAAMIFSFGQVSGAHINPAVSIAFCLVKKLKRADLPYYILSQVLGALVASFLLLIFFPETKTLGQTNPSGALVQTFGIEVLITFILMLVILRIPEDGDILFKAAISVGGTVLLLALCFGPITGASMNPARSIGPALVFGDITHLWMYIVAPILGASLAVPVDRFLK